MSATEGMDLDGRLAVVLAVTAVGSFLLGSVNPALIVARLLGRDLRGSGSGNPGATNAGRVLGVRWGVLVGALDVAKGVLPAYLAMLVPPQQRWQGYLAGVAAVLGHAYSPFLRGRGGKAVATALGAVLAVHPWWAVLLVGVFAVVVVVTRWVALGSVAAGVVMVGAGVGAGLGWWSGDWWTCAWAAALGAMVVWRHRRNLRAWRTRPGRGSAASTPG
ncbi:MAG: glycerol-3-phosphate 1-O-acyltransferase PlsY [Dermatophilaceae bacterium]